MDMADMEDMDVVMEAMVDTVIAVMDTGDTVERDQLMPSHGTDMDTPDTHTLMVDTDTHTLMLVLTSLARDLPNHPHTMVMDTAVVMDMVVTDTVDTVERDPLSHTTDMVDTVDTEDTDMAVVMATDMAVDSYFQEAKRFYYLIFKIDV